MRSFRIRELFIASIFAGLSLYCQAAAEEPVRLRVLTYNIHHGEGTDGKLDLERIARVIRSSAPDVVSLQEVDQGTVRTNGVDQPAELSRLTGMPVVFGKNIDYEGGAYGNAVLTTLPIKAHENIRLPSLRRQDESDKPEQRGALVVELEGPAGTSIMFIATHLDHRRRDDERLASADVINARFADRYADRAAVLVGDLNGTPQSDVLKRFAAMWEKAGRNEIGTVPVRRPRRQIDYVLYRPANRWRVVEVRVLEEPVASEHRPLLAVLELLSDVDP